MSPNNQDNGNASPIEAVVRRETALVTPSTTTRRTNDPDEPPRSAQRQLFPPRGSQAKRRQPATPALVSPGPKAVAESPAKKRLIFGRYVTELAIAPNVRQVYKIVNKLTGSIGGNASSGPIYGELTMGSMQKMVNLMKEKTGFDANSRFVDVGSGIGKPNLHVAQDPGVAFSYGIEVEYSRWLLGLHCLKGVLDEACRQQSDRPSGDAVQGRCVFEHADIRKARSFDPFSHVYMFSIGFPPVLWDELSDMWNRSRSPYLICYHGPKDIIRAYEFDVELLAQIPTSMHGSKEVHTGYIYQRRNYDRENQSSTTTPRSSVRCDPAFADAWALAQRDLAAQKEHVDRLMDVNTPSGPSTRSKRRRTD